jgi:hypothetical protein
VGHDVGQRFQLGTPQTRMVDAMGGCATSYRTRPNPSERQVSHCYHTGAWQTEGRPGRPDGPPRGSPYLCGGRKVSVS